MGWTSFVITNVVLTTCTLGALKRHGAIVVDGSKIKNEAARMVFIKAVALGEEATLAGERLSKQAYETIMNPKK
ncbi:hypothetical protein FOA52_007463 [Chlamydomonas sp. UWO 241]|nr:hypothetical protein FOA52_007463 [Chlamydomonas sp. UWO 241]